MEKNTALKSVLLLAANPKGTKNLRLHEEEREIKERLRLAGYGKVPINSTEATRPRDIQQAMVDFNPQIVHFSGHGAGQDGLVFEDVSGQEKLVSSEALANLFKIFSKQHNRLECVVLNACYSEVQAEAIGQHIDYVIGMKQSIGDRAAIEFAIGFYIALGGGESIDFAYELGCNAIQLEGIPEHLTPTLIRRNGLLPAKALSSDSYSNARLNLKVDLTRLKTLLKDGKWRLADQETRNLLLRLADESDQNFLNWKIDKIPCPELCAIDQLWVDSSDGHFGFSVQKRMWQSEFIPQIDKIAPILGWKINDKWLTPDELNFSISAPLGHLPGRMVDTKHAQIDCRKFFEHVQKCL